MESQRFVAVQVKEHRNLTTSQRALIAAGFLEYEREQARKRQGARTDIKENFPECSAQARDKAGARVHVSGRMVDDAAKVIAQAVPEVLDKVRSGDMAINDSRA